MCLWLTASSTVPYTDTIADTMSNTNNGRQVSVKASSDQLWFAKWLFGVLLILHHLEKRSGRYISRSRRAEVSGGKERILTWSLTFRLSTSTTLFCRKWGGRRAVRDLTIHHMLWRVECCEKRHRNEWRTLRQAEEKGSERLSVRQKKQDN